MQTRRMTMAQALVGFLKNQYVERDGTEHQFFHGAWGIFGHGCIAGLGQALQQNPDFRYYQCKNEQAAVHIAAAFAKTKNRLGTFACISSIGPGRDEHGDRRGHGDHQPAARAVAARRHFRAAQRRARAAAARVRARPGRLGERRIQARIALLGSHQPARPADLTSVVGSDARAHVSRANRRGHAGAAAGRAVRSVGLSRSRCSRSASGTSRGRSPSARCSPAPVEMIRAAKAAADRRRRRRPLQRGD